jgi:glucosamine 6-phosphate synthetase-like amidotransferase/phosphosugar isomerase protein
MAEIRTPRSAHPYDMYECVYDQPRAIRQVLHSQGEAARALAERIAAAQRVHLVGIGTSWHGSLVGEYLLRQVGDCDIAALVDHPIFLPQVPEFLTPVVHLAPLHLFTYWLALEMGRTPDTFRRHEPRHAAALRDVAF